MPYFRRPGHIYRFVVHFCLGLGEYLELVVSMLTKYGVGIFKSYGGGGGGGGGVCLQLKYIQQTHCCK